MLQFFYAFSPLLVWNISSTQRLNITSLEELSQIFKAQGNTVPNPEKITTLPLV